MPGHLDETGSIPKEKIVGKPYTFEVPTVPTGGTREDMGSLALFLVVNHFVNGETVLIDGGVRIELLFIMRVLTRSPLKTLLKHPSSY
jgi:hypothetical protein